MPKHANIPITKADEPYCRVTLANGAVLVMRTIVIAAHQIMNDDDTPRVNDDGKALVGLNTQTLVAMEQEPINKKEMN